MTAPILILAHATDAGAASVAAELHRRLGSDAVLLLRPEVLGLAQWSHRIDDCGTAVTRLRLPSGIEVDSRLLRAVLHRIQVLPMARFRRAPPKDRDYAAAELQAVVASWLAGLGDRVVPSVRRRASLNLVVSPIHWAVAAVSSGLPVNISAGRPLHSGPVNGTVVVAGQEVGGVLAGRYGAACHATAAALEAPLVEFRFAASGGRSMLIETNLLPSMVDPSTASMVARLLSAVASS